jgi:hypothetical protein
MNQHWLWGLVFVGALSCAKPCEIAAPVDTGNPPVDTSVADTANPPVDTSPPPTGNKPTFAMGDLPNSMNALSTFFTKHIDVFGVHVVATTGVADAKMTHAAHVLAQYLDNDEDGVVDNAAVGEALAGTLGGATLVMFASQSEIESSGIFESNAIDQFPVQDLYATETHPEGSGQAGFDATLEEVLHLVTHYGFSAVYPDVFGETKGSSIADAMDLARGGYFATVPNTYPPEAWYHYDDMTCEYGCMVTEYFYWALTSLLGAQDYPGRCEDIAVEWEACTEDKVQSMDPAVYALLTDPQYKLPTVIPDGTYGN